MAKRSITVGPRPEVGRYYRHFKPGSSLYKVICLALDEQFPDLESVIYQDCYSKIHYSRAMSSWQSRPEKNRDRFEQATRHDLRRLELHGLINYMRAVAQRHSQDLPASYPTWDEAIAHHQNEHDALPRRSIDTQRDESLQQM